MDSEETDAGSRFGGKAAWLLGGTGLFGLTLLGLWTQREPIAENFIARELTTMGVQARYELVSVGLRTQRIENIALGDPARPDLTARWVEVDLTLSGLMPSVAAVRAGGVRLHGRYHDGVLSLGELDKFRDPRSTAPFSLPDIAVGLDDARMRLDTDYGAVGMKLQGNGNLQDGFAGKLAAVMPAIAAGGCTGRRASAYVDLSMRDGQPHIAGPLRAAALGCGEGGPLLAGPVADMDVTLGKALDSWAGRVALSAQAARGGGATIARPALKLMFDGNMRGTRGQADLTTAAARYLPAQGLRMAGVQGSASWSYAPGAKGPAVRVEGTAGAQDVRYGAFDPVASARALAQTPVGPLAERLAIALRNAGRDNHLRSHFALAHRDGAGAVVLTDSAATAASGARVALGPDSRFTVSWPNADWRLAGSVTMEGGDLPHAALRLTRHAAGGLGGQLFVDDYIAKDARLSLEPVRFFADKAGGTRFTTALRLKGPLEGGGVDGLSVPVTGRIGRGGTLAINPDCTPLSVERLTYSGFAIGKTRLTACPDGPALLAFGPGGMSGGAVVRAPRIAGRLGQSPLRLAADSVRLTLAQPGFDARAVDLSIGPEGAPVHLAAASLTGGMQANGMRAGGFGGKLAGTSGRIGAVPLLASDAAGDWSFADGTLSVRGGLTLSDAAAPDRFNPLLSRDFTLAMRNGRITARGTLREPRSDAVILTADIVHDLGPGKGKADIAVPGITFSPRLQPERVTRLALGVIANASGTVSGKGQVRWTGDSVTSDGVFSTDRMDFAAAFGPVTGLSGEIRFTDLLGMVSAPHQEVRIASANPGIEATDGVVRYQLQAGQKVHVEGGEWPFSGGRLLLLPTTMDFSAETERYLTFRVIGIQAGEFINKMELENISATGVFDGIMPLIFNAQGGRIAGGVLVARQEGLPPLIMPEGVLPSIPCDPRRLSGTLSYVGPVSNEQVGVMGKLAFDALKDLQYKCLSIFMDGALDGEVVTNVVFNGVNRGQLGGAPKSIAKNFIGLPFLFNVKIQAPFRGLMGTARSLVDPSELVRDKVGDQYQQEIQQRAQQGLAVKPPASETVPQKEE